MSGKKKIPIRYQRGKIIINGNTRHDEILRTIDLVSSKIILLLRIPGIAAGAYKLARFLIDHYH